ncbi:MAG: glycosyltransferase [Clostridiales bacterium]|nr:glycosyltransferase [Clostridiales bacterium]
MIYFSSCAIHPNGENDPFMMMEQPWLVSRFGRVMMAAHQGADWLNADPTAVHQPRKPFLCGLRGFCRALFSADVRREWQHLRQDGVFSPVNALKVLLFAARGQGMFLAADALLPKEWRSDRVYLYSCWMSFDAYAAVLMKRKYPSMQLRVRGHAFDIDVDRNPVNPYLMKQAIANAADGLYLISEASRAQYMSYMQGRVGEEKVHVLAFGSAGSVPERLFEPPLHEEGILRVVSCAKVIPIKQVHVLAEALAKWEGVPVHWTHIGDGEGLEALQEQAAQWLDRKENVIVQWMGGLSAEDVLSLYEKQPFDVFINTSQKEGVPVSIMEAMRCGVPAIAPAVGGLPELITDDTGWLYAPQEGAEGVRRCLQALVAETPEQADRRRLAAAERWKKNFQNTGGLEKMFGKKDSPEG